MALTLRLAPAVDGLAWVRGAFALYARRPMGFTAMFLAFLLAVLLAALVPVLGAVFMLMSLPLLGLGFMLAARAARAGEPVHPGAFVEPLRAPPPVRNVLLALCGLYALATAAVMLFSDWVDGGSFERLQTLLAQGPDAQAELDALLADPRLSWGMIVRFGLAALISVPFWHAPPLVLWQAQGLGQALFSSTLALWRCRAAFAVYALAWTGLILAIGLAGVLVFSLLGAGQLAGIAAMPAALILSTVFYVSLLFTYEGCFSEAATPPVQPPAPAG